MSEKIAESAERDNGGPAFPELGNVGHNSDWQSESGMSLRDWFASHCPLTFSEAWSIWTNVERVPFDKTMQDGGEREDFLSFYAQLRFEYADAMIVGRR